MTFIGGSKNIRLTNYDYRNGAFFITNKTNFSKPYLVGSIYKIVSKELKNIPKIYSRIILDFATIVPTHLHCILIFNDSIYPLSIVWQQFKARCTYKAKQDGFIGKTLWQKNYFEHVIRNEKALSAIREYIRNNPLKENLPLDEIY